MIGPMADDGYYYCLKHATVEQGAGCRALDRMGPYPSAAAAADWKSQVEANNEAWDADDADRPAESGDEG